MKKLIKCLSVVLCIAIAFGITACTAEKESPYEAANISVACLKGPTGVGMAPLMEKNDSQSTANNYTFTIASAADEISGKIISGEINIASVPTNLAAKLYNKTEGKLVMLAVNTLGVLSILENGNSIKSAADLKGKTIYSTGEGSNPEYILRFVLAKSGIDPDKDVSIKFFATNDELTAAVISGTAQVAMVPEPAATTILAKKDSVSRVLSMNDEWEKISESKLMMGCVVALKSYVESNPDAVKSFLAEYKTSIETAQNDIDTTSALCEKYGIIPAAAVAKNAIPECNLTFVSGDEMKTSIEGYFQFLLDADKTSIGGKLPSDDFYYNEK